MQSDSEQPFPRITQDQIIIQNQQTASTLQAVICPVCLTVLDLPHWTCQGCDNAFCKTCLQVWWQKQPNTCIFKCQDPHFKVVKRSSTYQAILDLLMVKCKDCLQAISVSTARAHQKTCPKKPIKCEWQGCSVTIARDGMKEHMELCQFKTKKCQFCEQTFLENILQQHQNKECPERIVVCKNEGCEEKMKAQFFKKHKKQCIFKLLLCQWCKNLFKKDELNSHCQICEQRQFSCEWCQEKLMGNTIKDHLESCSQRKVTCPLCKESIKETHQNDHRQDCMFNQIMAMKKEQQILFQENVKLKKRVNDLEYQLEQATKNQHTMTAHSLIKIKQEQKKEYEKDLLRLRNSIASIKKCRNEEMSEHLKKLHLSTSLCGECQIIKKKLADELQPLLRLQDEAVNKIRELERIQDATRKSVIRL